MLATVQVSSAAARALHHQAAPTSESQALSRLASELGIELRPLHPGSSDPTLQTYFVADLPDGPDGARSVERLRDHPAVAAAYVKPPDALP
jgi:hypothetical protein